MSTATTSRLTADALAIIDLRYLTQSELLALSHCTSNPPPYTSTTSNPSPNLNDADLPLPKLDPSVFNESAGSKKQTYSRLRLAPRQPEISISNSNKSSHQFVRKTRADVDDEEGEMENRRIVGLLKEIIGSDDVEEEGFAGLVEAKVECDEEMEMVRHDVETARQEVRVDIGAVSPVRRRRGRPRKEEAEVVNVRKIIMYDSDMDNGDYAEEYRENVSKGSVEDDRELANRNGEVVDLERLENEEDPFGEELRRRTEGKGTKEELLEFLNGLEGQWVSRRRKRKIVEAEGFGDALPLGWKLLFSIKKKGGVAWIICRRYIRFVLLLFSGIVCEVLFASDDCYYVLL